MFSTLEILYNNASIKASPAPVESIDFTVILGIIDCSLPFEINVPFCPNVTVIIFAPNMCKYDKPSFTSLSPDISFNSSSLTFTKSTLEMACLVNSTNSFSLPSQRFPLKFGSNDKKVPFSFAISD